MLNSVTPTLLLAISLFGLPQAFAAIGPSATFTVINQNLSPDGFDRSAVLVNGVFPGPLLTGNKGDRFQIGVTDSLTDNTMELSTSIHWHGITQNGTNFQDGSGWITQCPLVPGESYNYDFQVPDQAGTFWYHSHVSTQYCDGLRGPMVVYDPHDPHAGLYDVDDDSTIITIADWYHNTSATVAIPSIADSTLINGLGRFQGGTASPLSVITVTSGKRYRFRLLALSCDPFYTFSIDGHSFDIIEADGVNTQPLTVNNITIFAGQRYSLVLNATQAVDNYWIRAEPRAGADGGIAGYDGGINSAILRYQGASNSEPTTTISATGDVIPLNEADLHPLENPTAPGEPYPGGADVVLNLDLGFNGTQFTINGVNFQPPSTPVLLQILSGQQSAQELMPTGGVFPLPRNKTIELSIPPGLAAGNPHPFHLHGHSFSVVRSAGNSTFNFANPVRRDVVSIGDTTDNVTIRFTTDNPGPWYLHCHIDFHLVRGLAIVFAEDTADTSSVDKPTPEWNQLCPAYENFTTTHPGVLQGATVKSAKVNAGERFSQPGLAGLLGMGLALLLARNL